MRKRVMNILLSNPDYKAADEENEIIIDVEDVEMTENVEETEE